MAPHKHLLSCSTCGLPVPFEGASCTECTAITLHAGGAGWRPPPVTVRRPLAPGDVLEGKWQLEELLGSGGMGQVYRARDLALERSVAVKLLHESLCEDPESVTRFEREARAMARLEHPHITPIYAVGQQEGRPFIVMKHLEGMSLARYLRSVPGPLPVPEVLALARQLCAGLDFIHQRGCVHRDIKPGNIFLSPGGHATLLDFGILWEQRGEECTPNGSRLGTPSYMAPEQARGEPVDNRADLFSLGLVLLEMLTGLPPVSTCLLLGQGSRDAIQALRAQAPWLPLPLAGVLVRATAMDPEQRYKGALTLLAELEDAEFATPVSDPPPSPEPAVRGRRGWRISLTLLGMTSAGALILGMLAPRSTNEAPAAPAPTAPVAVSAAATPPASLPPGLPQDSAPAPVMAPVPEAPASKALAASRAPTPKAPHSATTTSHRTQAKALRESSTVTVEGGARPQATPSLGELRVVTLHEGRPVWANVSVDGKHHGATPVSLDLPGGRHSVRVERDGFVTEERKIEISPGTKEVIRIQLQK